LLKRSSEPLIQHNHQQQYQSRVSVFYYFSRYILVMFS
jgi:hypothetical protein